MRNVSLLLLLTLLLVPALFAEQTPAQMYDFMAARLAAEQGDYSKAVDLINKVIAKNPKDPVLLYERAMIYVDAAKLDKAVDELRNVTKLYPDFYDAQKLLGRILIDQSGGEAKKVEDALTHLTAAFKARPDDVGTGLAITQIYLGSDRLTQAEKILEQLAETAPDNRTVNFQYAQVLTKVGKGDKSKVYLERVVAGEPTFGPAIFQLVDIYQQSGEWIKAAEVLAPLIGVDPLNLELQRRQAYYYLRAGDAEKSRHLFEELLRVEPNDERSRFFYAESLSELQEYEKANTIYRSLLQSKPDDPELLMSFGSNQLALRQYDDAGKTFQALLNVPGAPEQVATIAKTQLALVEYQKKNYGEALTRARKALDEASQPNYQAAAIVLDIYKREARPDEAVAFIDGLAKRYPDDQLIKIRQLECVVRAGRQDRADELTKALVTAGDRGAQAAAQAYVSAENWNGAIAILENLRKKMPDDVDVLFQLGAAYERAGKVQAAEEAFQTVLSKQPDQAGTLNYLGYMWADRGVNLDRAEEMLVEAVRQQPRNGAFVDSLGWVYYKQGKLDLAKKQLEDAMTLMPRDATVKEHVGDVYLKMGQKKSALDQYKEALTLDPEAADETRIRQKVTNLEKAGGRK